MLKKRKSFSKMVGCLLTMLAMLTSFNVMSQTDPEDPAPTNPTPQPFTVYTCDFDDDQEVEQWHLINTSVKNKWRIAAVQEGQAKSLFISDDGTKATYDKASASVAVAYREINFMDNDSVAIKFDLNVKGESTSDYLKVFLAPKSVDFTSTDDVENTEFAQLNYDSYAFKFADKYYLNFTEGTVTAKIANPTKNEDVRLVFVWVNDGSYGEDPAAVINNLVIVGDDIIYQTVCNDSTTMYGSDKYVTETGLYTVPITLEDGSKINQKIFYTVIPQDTTIIKATICQGETYKLNGFNQTEAGTYYQQLESTSGCNSVLVLELTVNETKITNVYDSICELDLPYTYNGNTYNTTGDFVSKFQTYLGCDSTVILHLNVFNIARVEIDTAICYGSTFTFNSIETDKAGVFKDTVLTKDNGEDYIRCIDSIYTFNVSILPNPSVLVEETVCYDSSFTYTYIDATIEGEITRKYDNLTESTEKEIKYTVAITNPNGYEVLCERVDTLRLTVRPKIDTAFVDTICFGATYTFSGKDTSFKKEEGGDRVVVLRDTLQSELCNCDSTITVNLYIRPSIDTTKITGDYCFGDTIKYGTKEYVCLQAGEYEDTEVIPSKLFPMCDSVIEVKINVFPQVGVGVIDTTICYHGEYIHEGTSKVYSFAELDTTVFKDTLILKNYNGCDSTLYINIYINENPSVAIYDTICYDSTFTYEYIDAEGEQSVDFSEKTSFVHLMKYDIATTTVNGYDMLCERVDTLNITVRPKIDTSFVDTICFGATYTLNGKDTSFNKEEGGGREVVLHDTLQSELCECDSTITVNLYIRPEIDTTKITGDYCFGDTIKYGTKEYVCLQAGEYEDTEIIPSLLSPTCDSVIEVKINVYPQVQHSYVTASICADSTLEYEYEAYETVGVASDKVKSYSYPDTVGVIYDTLYLKNENLCDSLVYLTLTVNPIYDTIIYDTICNDEVYTLNDVEYSYDGKYVQYLKTVESGCDSIVRLYLTVHKTAETNFDINICQGDSYSENNFNENTTGVYVQNLQTVNGCDSTVTLNLNVSEVYHDTIVVNQCYGTLYNDNGFLVSEQGVYTNDYVTENGCDSTVTLVLNILDVDTTIEATICEGESYLQNGFNAKTAGSYKQYLKTTTGCDSIVTLNLQVIAPIVTNIKASICQGETYTQNGFNVQSAGKYTSIYESVSGCDSTVILNLTVNPVYDIDIVAQICAGEIYNNNGFIQTTAGVYTHNLHSLEGCDSTVTLILTVKDLSSTINASICQGEVYTDNGFNANKTGQYSQTIKTEEGCDSLVTLNLTVNPVYDSVIDATICEGQTYTQNGFTEQTTGVYVKELQTVNGCDSTVTLNLTVAENIIQNISASICDGETYTQYGFNATKTGTFTKQFKSYKGCDSTLMLNLTVNPVYDTTMTAEIWYGDLYNQFGFLASDNGTYVQNKQTINGCDSILTLILTVKDKAETTINASICNGETYTQNGFNQSTTGTYTQTLKNFKGLDSIVTLNLKVNPTYDKVINATICQGETYNLNGFNKSTSGTYKKSLKSINGCDSIVTLNLTVNPTYSQTISATICEGETYNENGFNKKVAGTYTQNLKTKSGCDSIITLNLTVNPKYDKVIDAIICSGETYTENGFEESEAGSYVKNLTSINGCDSVVTLNLSVKTNYDTTIEATICQGEVYSENGFNETESGEYEQNLQSIFGCDSVVHLIINVNPTYDVTVYDTIESGATAEDYSETVVDTLQTINGCDSVVTTITYYHFTSGLEEIENVNSISIYPNPASSEVTIAAEDYTLPKEIFIVDNAGRTVKQIYVESGAKAVKINVSDIERGVYYVKIGGKVKKLIVH